MIRKQKRREKFSCNKQQHEDLWYVIRTIKPVISLIRRRYPILDDEIKEYISYINTFSDFTYEDYKYLMGHSSRFGSETLEAVTLLSVNHGIKEEEREKIRVDLNKLYHGYNMFWPGSEDTQKNFIEYIGTHFH